MSSKEELKTSMTEEKTKRRLCQRIANGIRYVENFSMNSSKNDKILKFFCKNKYVKCPILLDFLAFCV